MHDLQVYSESQSKFVLFNGPAVCSLGSLVILTGGNIRSPNFRTAFIFPEVQTTNRVFKIDVLEGHSKKKKNVLQDSDEDEEEIHNQELTELAPMRELRYGHGSYFIDGGRRVIVFGGAQIKNKCNRVVFRTTEYYDLEKN